MSSNYRVKKKMIDMYGNQCFVEALGLRKDIKCKVYKGKASKEKIEQMLQVKYLVQKRYRKQFEKIRESKLITYHHIKEKSKGGEATVNNGALLKRKNHDWFNKQPRIIQEKINIAFQMYKKMLKPVKRKKKRLGDIPKLEIDIAELMEADINKFLEMAQELKIDVSAYLEELKKLNNQGDCAEMVEKLSSITVEFSSEYCQNQKED